MEKLLISIFIILSNADATCNFFPCESVIFVQFPCSISRNGKMIESDDGDRWSRGCPMDDEFSGFYVIDGIKSKILLIQILDGQFKLRLEMN